MGSRIKPIKKVDDALLNVHLSKDFIKPRSKYTNWKIPTTKRKTFIDLELDERNKLPGPSDYNGDQVMMNLRIQRTCRSLKSARH